METSDSQSVYSEVVEDPLHDLGNDELLKLLEETLRGNEVLITETQMFEKFLQRVDPRDGPLSSISGSITQRSDKTLSRLRSRARSSAMDKSLKLTAEQKCDIAQREIEELRDEINLLKDNSEKVLDTLKAIMEESDMRLSEMKKDSYEFERDIVKGSINYRTHKVVAEKCIRYFEDKLRTRDALIEKLRLKNAQLKVQKKKLMMQLRQIIDKDLLALNKQKNEVYEVDEDGKEEMGEVLNEVDFNQLKIENQQYLEKIDERNQDLLRLKLMAGNTLQVLNSYKKKLLTLTKESERLKSEITSRQDMDSRIQAETAIAEAERTKAEQMNKKLRKQLNNFKVPSVMDYVIEKSNMYDLQKKLKSWERKVDIAEMALKTHRKTWEQMQLKNPINNNWRSMMEV